IDADTDLLDELESRRTGDDLRRNRLQEVQQHFGGAHVRRERDPVCLIDDEDLQPLGRGCRELRSKPGTRAILQDRFHAPLLLRNIGRASRPANRAFAPSDSSMRNPSFHFAVRSERAKDPTLSCPQFQPTARCTMVTSSVSPERAETMV